MVGGREEDKGAEQDHEMDRIKNPVRACPANNDALLINFRLSSDAENFVNKHRLSMQTGAKTCKKTCMQRVHIPTELPFCMPSLVVG